jgi:hypothetical protein
MKRAPASVPRTINNSAAEFSPLIAIVSHRAARLRAHRILKRSVDYYRIVTIPPIDFSDNIAARALVF